MHFAAKVADVPNFGKKQVTVNGVEVLLVNVKGEIFACEHECPHQSAPLAGSIVQDGHLSCPRHGYRFNLKTGACKDAPQYTLKVYPVQILDGDVLVDLGA
jgi:nitrite reductase/ring-hydroxylating ferredoxin subunit